MNSGNGWETVGKGRQTMSYFSDLDDFCWFIEPGFERQVCRLHPGFFIPTGGSGSSGNRKNQWNSNFKSNPQVQAVGTGIPDWIGGKLRKKEKNDARKMVLRSEINGNFDMSYPLLM
jgi:hypothetical protein